MRLKLLFSIFILSSIGVLFQNCAEDFGSGLQTPNTSLSLESNEEENLACEGTECFDDNDDLVACTFNSKTLELGESVIAYHKSTVPFGSSCQPETRFCGSMGLTGSAQYGSCSVGAAASCLHNGITVAHGAKITAYAKNSVSYGQSCSAVQLTCFNGALSPNPTTTPYTSCKVAAPIVKWVNAGTNESHLQTCSRAGLFPSKNKGYGICASGERRPTKGTGYNSISYKYGTWGGAGTGGTQIIGYYCYASGQKRDNDRTDRTVAYLCSQEPNL